MASREFIWPEPAFTDYNCGRYPKVDMKFRDKVKAGEIKVVHHRQLYWNKNRKRFNWHEYRLRIMKLKRRSLKDPGLKFYKKVMPYVFKGQYHRALYKALGYFQKKKLNERNVRFRTLLIWAIKNKPKDLYESVFRQIVETLERPEIYGYSQFSYDGYHDIQKDPYPAEILISRYYTKMETNDEGITNPVIYHYSEHLEEQDFLVQKEFQAKEDEQHKQYLERL